MKKYSILFVALLVLTLGSCQTASDIEPGKIKPLNNSQEDIALADFEQRIKKVMTQNDNGESGADAIFEELGFPYPEAFAKFRTESGTMVGFIPVFREDSKQTEAVIIATIKEDIPHYALLERGYLYPYQTWNSEDNKFPTVNAMADIFMSYDKIIFNNSSSLVSEIIGSDSNTEGNEVASLTENSDANIKTEWVGQEICHFTFTGTRENPYQNLTDIWCQTTWTWERVPSQPELLDAGGGGGGGNGGGFVSAKCNYYGQMGLDCKKMEKFEQDYKRQMSVAELKIFEKLSTWNKAKYLSNALHAMNRTNELYPFSTYNGIGDAFRHALFSALNTSSIGSSLAEQLQTAHEQGNSNGSNNPYLSKETQMDLFNNAVGRSLGIHPGYIYLEAQVIAAIKSGQLRYLNNLNPLNGQPTADSRLIPTNQ